MDLSIYGCVCVYLYICEHAEIISCVFAQKLLSGSTCNVYFHHQSEVSKALDLDAL